MIIGSVIDAKSFNWDKGVGVADLSDFGPVGRHIFDQLFDDACDQGFRVVGKTNVPMAFYLDHADKDGSGEDIYGWHFYPINSQLRDAGVRIMVIND